MKIIENVIYREVVVVEVASSELGNSWTLAENVIAARYSRLGSQEAPNKTPYFVDK